ncbi:MAG TPA: hypothetical protein PK397_13225 [Ignavibacteriaceae bacterium]|jgi:hypothetical protein|nr:hypothetical protein [Ignavibacteriaceae bacterium]
MYRGFKTYRHFLNAKLHALSIVICGDNTVIDAELQRRGLASVIDLSLKDAKLLYKELSYVAKKTSYSKQVLNDAIGLGKITKKQRNIILKITRYNFRWTDEAIFSFIAEMFPNARKRLSIWEVQNSKLYKLINILDSKDADKIIKRLLGIEKRNKNNAE